MNNLTKTFLTAALSLGLLFSATMASAATCSLSNVNLLDGAPPTEADTCEITLAGNNGNPQNMFGSTWYEVAKIDPVPGASTTGTWDFSGYAPLLSEFVIVLKASNDWAAYLFTTNDADGIGYYNTSDLGNGGHDISHISLYSQNPVPLPAALWLFAPALMGLMGLRRKAKATVA